MLESIAIKLGEFKVLNSANSVSMIPFSMQKPWTDIPRGNLLLMALRMCRKIPIIYGKAFLTVDDKVVEAATSHRRPGPHIDGNYIYDRSFVAGSGWGWGTAGGGNGWKVGGDGRTLTKWQHEKSYETTKGGMLIASSAEGCVGWTGVVEGKAGVGGDCSHLDLSGLKKFTLEPNTLYYGNSQFIHESIPMKETTRRTLIRITLPDNYPWLYGKG